MTATCMIYDQRLKAELQSLRRKGTTSLCISREEANDHPPFLSGRACTRCRGELGRIINRGANCPSCNQRVCKSCRHYDTNRWLCLVCYKQIEQISGQACEPNNARLSNGRTADRADLINANIQRSCSFSDVDPPAWSFLRCSPDMRAYSSMPRNRIIEYNSVRLAGHQGESLDHQRETNLRPFTTTNSIGSSPEPEAKLNDIPKDENSEYPSPTYGATPVTSPEQSPVIDKKNLGSPILRSTFIRNLSLRKKEGGHTWYIPPGVTPPRSRRRLNTGDSADDHEGLLSSLTASMATSMCCNADSDDYRLVFISSSDSSSREELASDDNSLLDEADWDYFECTKYSDSPPECGGVSHGWGQGGPNGPRPGDFLHLQGQASHPYPTSASRPATGGQCVTIHVPVPVPFPFPIPVFVPVPVPTKCDYEMTSNHLPDSEILPIDECLCHKAVSPIVSAAVDEEKSGKIDDDNNVVLKVYKTLDDTDSCPIIQCTPEDILRSREARLKDFTEYKDDDSSSSVSTSDDDGEDRAPKTRVYKLHDDNSSADFDITASPPASLTSPSASESSDDERNVTVFRRTFVLHESSSDDDDVDGKDDKNPPESDDDDGSYTNERLPQKNPLPTIQITNDDNNVDVKGHSTLSEERIPVSRISVDCEIAKVTEFSKNEISDFTSEFLNEERKMTNAGEEKKRSGESEGAGSKTEADAGLKSPETRSNASDEFSGTESMEMPLEDSLECRQPGSRGAAEGAAGELEGGGRRSPCSGGRVGESSSDSSSPPGGRRFTSLVMITQENGPSSAAPMTSTRLDDNKATSMCLEEGLADDDSWVEDLDREEIVTTTEESSEDDGPYPDREEELRGYHRSAIDFTLHTIAEESCEESEVENDVKRPTELEKYFFYGLGGVTNGTNGDKIDVGDSVVDFDEDAMSETSSIFSEGVDSNVSATEDETSTKNHLEPSELASSRLEKYFLSGFMGFRRDSDGSVGSDSEGRPSPEQRRKRLVRARGTGRSSHSTSLDNLLVEQPSGGEQAETVVNDAGGDGSSTETDSHDELVTSFDKADGQFDTVKRSANQTTSTTKKKKRSVPSCDEMTSNVDHVSTDDSGGNKTPQPMSESDLLRTKQQSRDSGFVGSCDDLLKESRSSETEDRKTDEGGTGEEKSTTTKTSTMSPTTAPSAGLIRKDSFNNWSSDEETNLMMSKMRAFFKTMVGSSTTKASPDSARPKKPPQLVYFESELTRLMKTVPGLKDEQVREIVEYLSSEDTWSDSYDSSDYTSSDLENSTKRSALQEEISASCRQIISNFESPSSHDDQDGDQDLVYQRLVASFNRIEQAKNITTTATKTTSSQNSPLLIEKVMSHIGTRLWALMHEVSGENQYPIKRLSSKISTTTEEEEDDEVATVDDYADVAALPRSKSHDPLLEELGRHEAASDNERFSWRGSFESALMAASDSRTRLVSAGDSCASSASALAAKRRSAGDLIAANCSSREQLDRVRSCGSIGAAADEKIWPRRRRRSSVPDSCDDSDDESAGAGGHRATLPRSLQSSSNTTNSLPRLPLATGAPIYKSHSVNQFGVKSARYRPPGYRGNQVPPPPPVRRDRNKRHNSMSSTSTAANAGCDDASICSDPVVRGPDEEVCDDVLTHRASLGARSDSMASVYSGAGEGRHGRVAVKGEVQFGLQYNYKLSSLEIRVQCCRDLAAVDAKRNRSDPYVKVYLLPDKSKTGKRKTKVKKHTLNPVFDDILRFQVDIKELEQRTLWLTVWHSDMFGRNDFLGEVLMPLENKVFDDPLPKHYTLQERSETLEELNSKGDLMVGLKYEPPEANSGSKKRPSKGTLYVLVKEAKNLPAVKSTGTSDPFCKSYLLPDKGRSTKQKAPVIKKTCSPAWNHTFTYNNVSLDELAERSLELTVWDHDRLASNEFLGGVRLNLGTGKLDGKPVEWMDGSGSEVTLWQRMMEKPKFWVEGCLPLRPTLGIRRSHDL